MIACIIIIITFTYIINNYLLPLINPWWHGPLLVLNTIHGVKFFAILADETRDVQNKEQLTTCIRWVDDQLAIYDYEDFIGLVHVEQTDAKSLYISIKYVHIRCSLFAATLARSWSRVRWCRKPDGSLTRFSNTGLGRRGWRYTRTLLAHCLNMCLQEAARWCSIIRDSLDIVNDISKLISDSPNRE